MDSHEIPLVLKAAIPVDTLIANFGQYSKRPIFINTRKAEEISFPECEPIYGARGKHEVFLGYSPNKALLEYLFDYTEIVDHGPLSCNDGLQYCVFTIHAAIPKASEDEQDILALPYASLLLKSRLQCIHGYNNVVTLQREQCFASRLEDGAPADVEVEDKD